MCQNDIKITAQVYYQMKNRRIHFVIHNQGEYSTQKKEDLLKYIKDKFPNLEGYLIAQEQYKHQNDTHLQGNLFFTNAITFRSLLKYLQKKYKETRTEEGLLGRIDIDYVKHEGRAMNYMVNSTKDGGDPDPLMELDQRKSRIANSKFDQELRDLIIQTQHMLNARNA